MESQKRFSIVIPVYKAETYLRQAVDSIIKQSYGFAKHVELVLVNDGSPDNSGDICREYQEKYPENIVYIEQENAGVSAARNAGVAAATGEIIGFLDADDKLSLKTLAAVNQYFRVALDSVDVAIIPVKNFGAIKIPYYLNGKFKHGTRTLDLNDPGWNYPCMRVGQAFVRSEAAKAIEFDRSITFFEDTKYINEIVAPKMRMGLVCGCDYFYRRYAAEADSGTSITTGGEKNKRLYLETPVKVILHFLERYENDEDTPLYFQYMALCELRWRTFYVKTSTAELLTPEEFAQYQDINDRILRRVSDKAILSYQQFAPWQRLYLLNMKHKKDVLTDCTLNEKNHIVLGDELIFMPSASKVLLYGITTREGGVEVEGYIHAIKAAGVEYFASVNGTKIPLEYQEETIPASDFQLVNPSYGYSTFRLSLPLTEEDSTLQFGVTAGDAEFLLSDVSISKRGDISHVMNVVNYCDHYIVIRKNNGMRFVKATAANVARFRSSQKKNKIKKQVKSLLRKSKAALKKGPVFFLKKVKHKLFK